MREMIEPKIKIVSIKFAFATFKCHFLPSLTLLNEWIAFVRRQFSQKKEESDSVLIFQIRKSCTQKSVDINGLERKSGDLSLQKYGTFLFKMKFDKIKREGFTLEKEGTIVMEQKGELTTNVNKCEKGRSGKMVEPLHL